MLVASFLNVRLLVHNVNDLTLVTFMAGLVIRVVVIRVEQYKHSYVFPPVGEAYDRTQQRRVTLYGTYSTVDTSMSRGPATSKKIRRFLAAYKYMCFFY